MIPKQDRGRNRTKLALSRWSSEPPRRGQEDGPTVPKAGDGGRLAVRKGHNPIGCPFCPPAPASVRMASLGSSGMPSNGEQPAYFFGGSHG